MNVYIEKEIRRVNYSTFEKHVVKAKYFVRWSAISIKWTNPSDLHQQLIIINIMV